MKNKCYICDYESEEELDFDNLETLNKVHPICYICSIDIDFLRDFFKNLIKLKEKKE